MIFRRSKKLRHSVSAEIAPDEIFLDSSNLPEFDKDQFEGQIEKPITKRSLAFAGICFMLIAGIFLYRIVDIELLEGAKYKDVSENNRLHHSLVFAERGAISDRNGKLIAWNTIPTILQSGMGTGSSSAATGTAANARAATNANSAVAEAYSPREYTDEPGMYNLMGYVKYPKKDKHGFYYDTEYAGADGIEQYFNNILAGENGLKINETDAVGNVLSESTVRPPVKGDNLNLSVDIDAESALYKYVRDVSGESGFRGGAAVVMDVATGEILASVSYPEYDSNVMTSGKDVEKINSYLSNQNNPFLDRISSGLYTPGSIIKPFFAFAALSEGIISPDKQIESTGEMKVPNPYRPGEFSIFKDWRVNGWTDMRRAIAVSSDIYFYTIGGGVPGQKGLGIDNIDKYARMFGFGDSLDNSFFSGKKGVIPTQAWKAENFNGDIWRLGDTYNTGIGQYGFQVTPIQTVRAVAALANDGNLLTPSILTRKNRAELQQKGLLPYVPTEKIPNTKPEWFKVVREGMRMAVTEGTMSGLNVPYVQVAGKTGTAQVGVNNQYINSWAVGFFPYQKPRYAFAVMLERGPSTALYGATAAMRDWLEWVNLNKPEYLN